MLAYNIAAPDLIPFDLPNYATQLETYYTALTSTIASASADLDISELRSAIDEFTGRTTEVKTLDQQARKTDDPGLLALVNQKYRDFQRGFVSQGGLPNRTFYKHLIFAPGLDTGSYLLSCPIPYYSEVFSC